MDQSLRKLFAILFTVEWNHQAAAWVPKWPALGVLRPVRCVTKMAPFTECLGITGTGQSTGWNHIKMPVFFRFGPTKPAILGGSSLMGIIFSDSHNNPWRQLLFGISFLHVGRLRQTGVKSFVQGRSVSNRAWVSAQVANHGSQTCPLNHQTVRPRG